MRWKGRLAAGTSLAALQQNSAQRSDSRCAPDCESHLFLFTSHMFRRLYVLRPSSFLPGLSGAEQRGEPIFPEAEAIFVKREYESTFKLKQPFV